MLFFFNHQNDGHGLKKNFDVQTHLVNMNICSKIMNADPAILKL